MTTTLVIPSPQQPKSEARNVKLTNSNPKAANPKPLHLVEGLEVLPTGGGIPPSEGGIRVYGFRA